MGRKYKRIGRPPKNSFLNAAGAWEKLDDKAVAAARSHTGEQQIGFYLGEAGYFIIEGPSGSAGHALNAHGFDGVAYHPGTGEIIIYDNKAWKKAGVDEATALRENLIENLEKQIKRIEARKVGRDQIPHSEHILGELRKALQAAKRGAGWPSKVKLYVYGVSGRSKTLWKPLSRARNGIKVEFKAWEELTRARVPWHMNPLAREAVRRLNNFAIREWEPLAAKALMGRARVRAGRAIARGAKFVEKRLPKLIAETILKSSAKAAAHRASSLVPVIGWAFDADDAYKGVEDILRGHTARGLAGIGLAVGDVASDFLHLGDAVSGVGGTALSIGAQVGIMAGQIKIEMDRQEEKMNELGEEVKRLDGLPPDNRLRDYYGLDDEGIADLKREFAASENEPESEPELPEPPPDIDVPAPLIPELTEPPPETKPHHQPKHEPDHYDNGGEKIYREEDHRIEKRWVDEPIA